MSGRLRMQISRRRIFAGLIFFILAGCATAPDSMRPATAVPEEDHVGEIAPPAREDTARLAPEPELQPSPDLSLAPPVPREIANQIEPVSLPEPTLPSKPRLAGSETDQSPDSTFHATPSVTFLPEPGVPLRERENRIADAPRDMKLIGRRTSQRHLPVTHRNAESREPARITYELHELSALGIDPSWPLPWPVLRSTGNVPNPGELVGAPPPATSRGASRLDSTAVNPDTDDPTDQTPEPQRVLIPSVRLANIDQGPDTALPATPSRANRREPTPPVVDTDIPTEQTTVVGEETAQRTQLPSSMESPVVPVTQLSETVEPEPRDARGQTAVTVAQTATVAPSIPAAPTSFEEEPVLTSLSETESRHQEATVERVVDELHISLPGVGWIYLGGGDSDVLSLLRKTLRDDGSATVFVFRTPDSGAYDLVFQKQDLTTGQVHEETVSLAPSDLRDTVAEEPRPAEVRPPDEAGVETLDAPITTAAGGEGDMPQSPASPAIPNSADQALELADQLIEDQAYGAAVSLLEEFLAQSDVDDGFDSVYFRLASLYEQATPRRDLSKARDLYRVIVSDFPFSFHWEQASARDEYITRHFFEIR